ncbi:MAG TPA: gephyrin-like molybdotransferase Glp [Bacillales bacterium]|nr:gephyrin-like molybdotransferase Glp [Bacillales bacterium]
MVEIRKPIAVSEAVRSALAEVRPLEAEKAPLSECDGRVLAEAVQADHDEPPFDRSPYDGFAVRAEDTTGASVEGPVELKVIEEIAAGDVGRERIGKAEAARIMTGAPIPEGADAVVMLEHVEETKHDGGEPYILVPNAYRAGDNISRQGEDTAEGTVQVEKGTVVTSGVKAVLATFGYAEVEVARRPVVGIFATGTELLDVAEEVVPGKIRNSNAYTLAAQVRQVGAEARYYGILKDDFDLCYEAVRGALDEVDVLVTTGGASVGDYDYLQEIFRKLDAEVCFNKVAMRPGSVTTVAKWQGKTLFALSGNPSACFVGFELFTRPVLRTMLGAKRPYLQKTEAVLEKDFPKANPFTRFTRAKVDFHAGKLYAKPVGLDKSNAVTPLAHANAFIVLPGGTKGYEKGSAVDVLLLNGEDEQWTVS